MYPDSSSNPHSHPICSEGHLKGFNHYVFPQDSSLSSCSLPLFRKSFSFGGMEKECYKNSKYRKHLLGGPSISLVIF